MLKKLIAIAVMLTAFQALADSSLPTEAHNPPSSGPTAAKDAAEASSIAAQKCTSGCLILSAEDVAILENQVNAFAKRAYQAGGQAGYEKGVNDLAGAALANPKICPKNT